MLREILEDVKEQSQKKLKNVDVTVTSIGMTPNKFTAGGAPSVTADVLREFAGDPLGDDPKYGTVSSQRVFCLLATTEDFLFDLVRCGLQLVYIDSHPLLDTHGLAIPRFSNAIITITTNSITSLQVLEKEKKDTMLVSLSTALPPLDPSIL